MHSQTTRLSETKEASNVTNCVQLGKRQGQAPFSLCNLEISHPVITQNFFIGLAKIPLIYTETVRFNKL